MGRPGWWLSTMHVIVDTLNEYLSAHMCQTSELTESTGPSPPFMF